MKANVEAFGGDPDNVTILGESAGAVNVWSLMVSPLTAGLFHKAVSMSGGITTTPRIQGLSYSHRLLKSLLVDDGTVPDDAAAESWILKHSRDAAAAYLRGKSTEEILAVSLAHSGLKEAPAMFPDGAVVPLDPHLAITRGEYHKVPMLASNTREEGKLFGAAVGAFRLSDYDRFTLEYNFDPEVSPSLTEADLLNSQFLPVDRAVTGWNTVSDLITQGGFLTGLSTSMSALATQQPDQMWYLRFDWAKQPAPFDTVYGAAHATDLPFWFGNFGRSSFS
ncbi:MAG: carboxylesterase/lipase family protein, partial [Comamonadaceae bacterium]